MTSLSCLTRHPLPTPALPKDHPSYETIYRSTVAAINYVMVNLTADGRPYANYESEVTGSGSYPFEAIALSEPGLFSSQRDWEQLKRLQKALAHGILLDIEQCPRWTYNAERHGSTDALHTHFQILMIIRKTFYGA